MANKIFKDMLQPKAHLSRNGFDRSYLHNFTAKIGELLPVMCLETVPGSYYEISVSDLMRTIPMYNPAYIRASQHFEFYFVPYSQIWHRWNDFYTTRQNPHSSINALNTAVNAAPCLPLGDMIDNAISAKETATANYGDLGENVGYGCQKLMNLLGYDGGYNIEGDTNYSDKIVAYNNLKPNLFRAAAYQKICYDYYRQPFYDLPTKKTRYAVSLDDAGTDGLLTAEVTDEENVTYKRSNILFQLHYRQWKKDLFTGVLPSTQFGAVSVVNTGGTAGTISQRITLPVTGKLEHAHDIDGALVSVESNFYRSDAPDTGMSVNSASPFSAVNGTEVSGGGYEGDFGVRAYNPNQPNNYQIVGATLVGNGEVMSGEASNSADPMNTSLWLENSLTADGTVAIQTGTGSFSVLDLVRSQAIQKWKEVTLRAGFRAQNQFKAHFGVEPIFTEKDKSVFIGSTSSPLKVNSVTNTTAYSSESSPALGDLAGNGTSVIGGNKIKFDAKDFGIIMCIYSMLPECTYQNFRLDWMNTKILRDDFFTPEYENLGLQVVPQVVNHLDSTDYTQTRGFVPRYSEYKCGVDDQTAEFSDGTFNYQGVFAGWSPCKGVFGNALRSLYVNPAYYRDIFITKPYSDLSHNSDLGDSKFDSFIHQCYFDIKCVQPMSVLGLPNY